MNLSEYIKSRQRTITSSIAAEQLADNEYKLGCERAAEAELRALEAFLSSAEYTKEPTQLSPNSGSQKSICLECSKRYNCQIPMVIFSTITECALNEPDK